MITALGGTLPKLHGNEWGDPFEQGVIIWDVKDPANPKKLSQWDSGGMGGVHRFFYSGGRYVHLSSTCDGFRNFIYRILDIADPSNPVEVGRWWMPDQWLAGQFKEEHGPDFDPEMAMLNSAVMHGPAYPKGDLAYVSWGGAGMVVLDISDLTLPQLVGHLRHHPPFAGKLSGARCHTVLPLSQRDYAVMTSEGERYAYFNEKMTARLGRPASQLHRDGGHLRPDRSHARLGVPLSRDPGGMAVQELQRHPRRRRRPVRPPQHPRAALPSRAGRPERPHLLLLLPRRAAGLRHQRSLRSPGDRLLHPAGSAGMAVQQQDRRPLPRARGSAPRKTSSWTTGATSSSIPSATGCTCSAARCSDGLVREAGSRHSPQAHPGDTGLPAHHHVRRPLRGRHPGGAFQQQQSLAGRV